jgi:DedD protein
MNPVGTAPALIDDSEDTEITLGTGKMLGLFFAQVILCAMFFGMGYSMGHNSVKSTAELLPSPGTSRATRLSPSAVTTAASQPQSQTAAPDQQQQVSPEASAATEPNAAATSATPDPNAAAAGQPASGTQLQPVAGYFVQVAAVSKQEDAQALVESLKGRQYQAFIADPTPDKLFHVQVGPFTDVKEAETMRTRLVNDGYNPILKK